MSARVLLVGPAWVGDMIMAGSLFRLLKTEDPASELTVIAPGATAPLLAFMPDVDHIERLDVRAGQAGIAARWRLGRRLAKARFGRAIVLPRSWKSALVPFFAGAQRRVGYAGEFRWGLLNERRRFDRKAVPRSVDRFLALGQSLGAPIPATPKLRFEVSEADQVACRQQFSLANETGSILALCPGAAYGPAKRWPAAHFARVASAWAAQGGQIWVLGQEADRDAGAEIAAAAPQAVSDFTGRSGLAEAVILLSLADKVVSNDSGLMHVAAALEKPLVALYGSSTAAETPPLSNKARVLGLDLSCRPCHKRDCPLGHLRCLRELTPAMVLSALDA